MTLCEDILRWVHQQGRSPKSRMSVRDTNVTSQVAIARRAEQEGKPKKVFVKCHINPETFQFDSDSAQAEVDIIQRLKQDVVIVRHLPRMERARWIEYRGKERVLTAIESAKGAAQKQADAGAQGSGSFLVIEFDGKAGNLVSNCCKEGMRLSEKQAGDACLQLLRTLHAMHALGLHHGNIHGSSVALSGSHIRRVKKVSYGAGRPQYGRVPVSPSTVRSRASMYSFSDGSSELSGELASFMLPAPPDHGVYHSFSPTSQHRSTFEVAEIFDNAVFAQSKSSGPVGEGDLSNSQKLRRELWQDIPAPSNHSTQAQQPQPLGEGVEVEPVVEIFAPAPKGLPPRYTRQNTAAFKSDSAEIMPAGSNYSVNHKTLKYPSALPPATEPLEDDDEGQGPVAVEATPRTGEGQSEGHTNISRWSFENDEAQEAGYAIASRTKPHIDNAIPRATPSQPPAPPSEIQAAPKTNNMNSVLPMYMAPNGVQLSPQVLQRHMAQASHAPYTQYPGMVYPPHVHPGMYQMLPQHHRMGQGAFITARSNASSVVDAMLIPGPQHQHMHPVQRRGGRAKSVQSTPGGYRQSHRSRSPIPPSVVSKTAVFQAAMQAGADRHMGAYGTKAKHKSLNPHCSACRRLQQMCADCRLKSGARVQQNPSNNQLPDVNRLGRKAAQRGAREKAARASAKGEGNVHVLLHMHGVTKFEDDESTRRHKIHRDVACVGALLLLAITGEDRGVDQLQKRLLMRQGLSRDPLWLMVSQDARSFIESLIMEQHNPATALDDAWIKRHIQRAAKVAMAVAVPPGFGNRSMRSVRGQSPTPSVVSDQSKFSVRHEKSTLGWVGAGAGSPRMVRGGSGTSLASQPSEAKLQKRGSSNSLVRTAVGSELGGAGSTPSMMARTSSAGDGTTLATRITEERFDEKGKKHVVTKFVVANRSTSSNPMLHSSMTSQPSFDNPVEPSHRPLTSAAVPDPLTSTPPAVPPSNSSVSSRSSENTGPSKSVAVTSSTAPPSSQVVVGTSAPLPSSKYMDASAVPASAPAVSNSGTSSIQLNDAHNAPYAAKDNSGQVSGAVSAYSSSQYVSQALLPSQQERSDSIAVSSALYPHRSLPA